MTFNVLSWVSAFYSGNGKSAPRISPKARAQTTSESAVHFMGIWHHAEQRASPLSLTFEYPSSAIGLSSALG
jgi:hypothetical protein